MKYPRILLFLALAGLGQAQFFSFPATRITKAAGVPSGTLCAAAGDVGKVYIRNDPQATGASLYVCANTGVGTYAWDLTGSGSGATAIGGLTDLKVTRASSIYTIAAGSVAFGNVVTAFSAATLTESDGSGSGTLRFEVDYNAGTPRLVVVVDNALTIGNYACSGCTSVAGTAFDNFAVPLATATMTSGAPGDPTDLRTLQSGGIVPVAGANITVTVTNGGRSATIAATGGATTTLWTQAPAMFATCNILSTAYQGDRVQGITGNLLPSCSSNVANYPDYIGFQSDATAYTVDILVGPLINWTSGRQITLDFMAADTNTGHLGVFGIQAGCRPVTGTGIAKIFDTAQALTFTPSSTSVRGQSVTLTGLTNTSACAAEDFHIIRVTRTSGNTVGASTDTVTGAIYVFSAEVSYTRTL